MRIRTVIFPVLAFFTGGAPAVADSPITSTAISRAYMDMAIVRKAATQGILDDEIAAYLSSPNNPLDAKAAVINALSWDPNGKHNRGLYWQYLSRVYQKSPKELPPSHLTADEIFNVGYLAVMDNYFEPQKAVPWLEKAAGSRRESFTIAVVLALTKGQALLGENDALTCGVYKLVSGVLADKSLTRDTMRPAAVETIRNYVRHYSQDCK